ncbi:Uncharacterised protein [Serratia proteamaculans]|nr:Uncharacterised protein [Serratia proteamaculans]
MDNKLSELSKPVAYVFDHGVMGPGDFSYGTPQMHSTAKDENASPLYSQEYVSALLAELEDKDRQLKASIRRESAARKGFDEQYQRAEAAESKLATPVRLPDIRSDDYHETGWFQHMKYYRDVERSLRAAGFTVGDE